MDQNNPDKAMWDKLMGTDPKELPEPPEIGMPKDGQQGTPGPEMAQGGMDASPGSLGAPPAPQPTIELGDSLDGDVRELVAQVLDELRQIHTILRNTFQNSA